MISIAQKTMIRLEKKYRQIIVFVECDMWRCENVKRKKKRQKCGTHRSTSAFKSWELIRVKKKNSFNMTSNNVRRAKCGQCESYLRFCSCSINRQFLTTTCWLDAECCVYVHHLMSDVSDIARSEQYWSTFSLFKRMNIYLFIKWTD